MCVCVCVCVCMFAKWWPKYEYFVCRKTTFCSVLCPLYTKVPSELGVTYVWKMQKLAPTRE